MTARLAGALSFVNIMWALAILVQLFIFIVTQTLAPCSRFIVAQSIPHLAQLRSTISFAGLRHPHSENVAWSHDRSARAVLTLQTTSSDSAAKALEVSELCSLNDAPLHCYAYRHM